MTDRLIFRPLAAWPHKVTPEHRRQKWGSTVTLTKALDHVRSQLRLLGCEREAYISADVEERFIRDDGQLRSTARTNTPGCIVSATHPKLGEVRWANDQYKTLAENLRAIGLTIQNLRAVERYGCVRDNEPFRGFKAIAAESSATMSRAVALSILAEHAGFAVSDDEYSIRLAFRFARSRTHPDRIKGRSDAWHAVQAAGNALGVILSSSETARD